MERLILMGAEWREEGGKKELRIPGKYLSLIYISGWG
jgi:hypothetical protein